MIEVKETGDGKWGLYLDGVLLGDSKHRYEADHAKQILLRYLQTSERRADLAKKRFIIRQVAIFAGLSSCLGIVELYHRRFGWHLGFDFHFFLQALGVMLFWGTCWYLVSLWMWSRTPRILADRRQQHRP